MICDHRRLEGKNMCRTRRGCLIVGLLIWTVVGSRPSEAQYTANFQTNLISGVTSNWSGNYIVGSNTFADALLVQSGGVLNDGSGCLGYEVGSSNNSVLVTGTGSFWRNTGTLTIGASG